MSVKCIKRLLRRFVYHYEKSLALFFIIFIFATFLLKPVARSFETAAVTISDLELRSTYECISVRASYSDDTITEDDILLEYKENDSLEWKQGHPLAIIPLDAGKRLIGSIFYLTEGTLYDVRVSVKGCQNEGCQTIGSIRTRRYEFPTGSGKHYYVDINGNDASPGTEQAPFRTIQKGADVAQPGDVIHVRPGIYRESITMRNSGTEDAYIWFKAEGDVKLFGAIERYERIDDHDDWVYDEFSKAYKTYIGKRTYNVSYDGLRLFNYSSYYKFINFVQEKLPYNSHGEVKDASEDGIYGGYWYSYPGYDGIVQKRDFLGLVDDPEGLFSNLVVNGYIDESGAIQGKFRALQDASSLEMDSIYANKKAEIYDILQLAAEGENRNGWLYVKLPDGSDPDEHSMQLPDKDLGIKIDSGWAGCPLRYIIIDGLEIAYWGGVSYTGIGIKIKQSSNIIVRNCTIHNTKMGIIINDNTSDMILVEDNEFYDTSLTSWAWNRVKHHDTEGSAIFLRGGGGSVIRRNKIYDIFNGVVASLWEELEDESYNYNFDIYDNYISNVGDDGLEPEGTCINIRMWNNTIKDALHPVSLAPITRGPVYVFRNRILNALQSPFKYCTQDNHCPGRTYAYHNSTFVLNESKGGLTPSCGFGNAVQRNNIFYGHIYTYVGDYAFRSPVDWDYDCFYTTKRGWAGTPWDWWIRWGERKDGVPCPIYAVDIEDFWRQLKEKGLKGQEAHGIDDNPLYRDIESYDITLQKGSPCIDAGVIIPNINDWCYSGSAPDIGAIEYGYSDVLMIATEKLSEGMRDRPYHEKLEAFGGKAPYTWSTVSGELLTGLSLNPDTGDISGIPKDIGNFSYSVQARDGEGSKATKSFTINISKAETKSDAGNDITVENGADVTLDGSGSICDKDVNIIYYSWDFDLSDGIQEDATGLIVSHTYSTPGEYTATLTITDSEGKTASSNVKITVNDITAPSVPTFQDPTVSSTTILLNWLASTDDVGIAGYKIDRGDKVITVKSTSYTDRGLMPETTYTYTITAYDAAGNESGFNRISIKTLKGATYIYRSVGPGNTSALAEGYNNALTISNSLAEFATSLPSNIGVGDVIQYDSDGDDVLDSLCFIHGRLSARSYKVKDESGDTPVPTLLTTQTWSIYRAYTSLYNAEEGIENSGLDYKLKDFDAWTDGRDLVANNEVWNIACYGDGTDRDYVNIEGWTTGESNYLRIYTPVSPDEVGVSQRHKGVWDEDAYNMIVITGYLRSPVRIVEEYVRIEGLQIQITASSEMRHIGIRVIPARRK